MTKGDIDGWAPWGRPVKPVAIGMCVLMATLTVFNILDAGELGALRLGDIVSVLTGTALAALVCGWAIRSQRMAEIGLFTAMVAYLLRMFFLLLTVGPTEQGVYLSLGAVIIAGGSYRLEVRSRLRERPGVI